MLKSLIQAKLYGSSNLLKMDKLTLPASDNKSPENSDVNRQPMAGPRRDRVKTNYPSTPHRQYV